MPLCPQSLSEARDRHRGALTFLISEDDLYIHVSKCTFSDPQDGSPGEKPRGGFSWAVPGLGGPRNLVVRMRGVL